jgi:hypothetical protein
LQFVAKDILRSDEIASAVFDWRGKGWRRSQALITEQRQEHGQPSITRKGLLQQTTMGMLV